ncbi:MAG: glutamate--cysteine ligase [Propionibacteriaceae bacterium]|jgi:carboxylate-amine ligase|nr:glutamate--cysteine ligase [Propionibacteriaceae bacterium]
MSVVFQSSPRSSVGIEWELHLVDLETGELAPAAAELIAAAGGGDSQPIRKEYLPCTVEIVSGVHRRVADAADEIAGHLDRLQRLGAERGIGLIGAGSHPFSRAASQRPCQTRRYDAVADKNQWWGRQMAICGSHVHVGVDRPSYVLPVTWAFARFSPYLLALTASSPFWEGEDTGFASQRTMLFQQLPTNGLPYLFDTWTQFESYVDDITACGLIADVSELRWDVRPSPRFGTVENRIPDAASTLAELACQAALTQTLGECFARSLDQGDSLGDLSPWFVKENKWRAARYGLDAQIITSDPEKRLLPLREGLTELVGRLRPIAADLSCEAELAHTLELLKTGASYERQRRAAAVGGTKAVVAALLEEAASRPRPVRTEAEPARGDNDPL